MYKFTIFTYTCMYIHIYKPPIKISDLDVCVCARARNGAHPTIQGFLNWPFREESWATSRIQDLLKMMGES